MNTATQVEKSSQQTNEATGGWNYPINTFDNALEVARAVGEAGGANVDVSKAVIAQALGTSATSGNFAGRLATARSYGLIEGSRNGYRLTSAAKQYLFPGSEEEKRLALLMLLKANQIFADLIRRFDSSKLPAGEMLANILFREFKVPKSWQTRVARFFIKAAEDAGIVDSQGYLRYIAARQILAGMSASSSSRTPEATELPSPSSGAQPSITAAPGMNAWVFSLGGKTVKVESSDDLSPELWKKLDAYIQVLKPFEEGKSK